MVACAHTRGQPWVSFLKTHPPCLVTETLTENQSSPKKLAGIPTNPGIYLSPPPRAGITSILSHAKLYFMWVSGDQTQFFMFARQAFYWLNHPPSPGWHLFSLSFSKHCVGAKTSNLLLTRGHQERIAHQKQGSVQLFERLTLLPSYLQAPWHPSSGIISPSPSKAKQLCPPLAIRQSLLNRWLLIS